MLIREIFEDNQQTDNQKTDNKKTKQGKETLIKRPFSPEKDLVIKPKDIDPWSDIDLIELNRIFDYGRRRKNFMQPDTYVPEPEELIRVRPPLA